MIASLFFFAWNERIRSIITLILVIYVSHIWWLISKEKAIIVAQSDED